ncbi:hypothetical protein ALC57_17651 [Trachymyrmex cornetzi]|uniref:Uncharacterized protein n=1 Tax=Trachymyrmex cornetzi TaxID=471704 RepID=A0A151ITC4_9HYME|nr:hypothetical protein ALC57_17651 [Trachymyrmex cornetzi]
MGKVTKTASVYRNVDNEITIDEKGYITCQTDSGLIFKINSSEVDLNGPPIKCTVDDEEILVLLTSTSVDTSSEIIAVDISNQENQQLNVARHNLEIFSWNDANMKLFLSLYREMKNTSILTPVLATTVLPTSSNVERRQEVEDELVASPDGDAATGSILTTFKNTNNIIAVAKRTIATGTTAKALQQYQEEIKEYRKTLENAKKSKMMFKRKSLKLIK